MSNNTNLGKFTQWLENKHDIIMGCEDDALKCLDMGDAEGYARKMREKAEHLKDLASESRPHMDNLPEHNRQEIEAVLGRFSNGAKTALSLGSVFYMSALLYRDDHKKGEPDNLMVFVEKLKNS